MQLGLTPWQPQDGSARGLTWQAEFAESLGYRSFWVPESHFNAPALPDPLMLLAAVAAGTQTIKLATTSYLLPLRNPLLAAEQVAILDQLCNGRVLLGVGRGYSQATLQAFNIAPSMKRALFEKSLDLMLRAWRGESIAMRDGDAGAVTLEPLPVQRPHPPVWVAAFGPKALAQAGRLGLPYLASPVETLAGLQKNFAMHADAVAAAGHARVTERPIMRAVFVSDSASQVSLLRQRLASKRPNDQRAVIDAVDDWAIVGDRHYVADKISQYKQELSVTHLVISGLRIDGIESTHLRDSIARIIELA